MVMERKAIKIKLKNKDAKFLIYFVKMLSNTQTKQSMYVKREE